MLLKIVTCSVKAARSVEIEQKCFYHNIAGMVTKDIRDAWIKAIARLVSQYRIMIRFSIFILLSLNLSFLCLFSLFACLF